MSSEDIQKQIDLLENDIHDQQDAIEGEMNTKKNEAYAARGKNLAASAPKNFWAQVMRSHGDFAGELMGTYDDQILGSVERFNVEFTTSGFRVEIDLSQNEYISDRKLWCEIASGDDFSASNVNWKEGKGPLTPEEQDEEEEEEESKEEKSNDKKRKRDDRGRSFFEIFEDLGPHPEDDEENEEFDDMEEDEFDDVVAEYEEDLKDNKEVLECLVKEIWEDPLGCLEGKYVAQ